MFLPIYEHLSLFPVWQNNVHSNFESVGRESIQKFHLTIETVAKKYKINFLSFSIFNKVPMHLQMATFGIYLFKK